MFNIRTMISLVEGVEGLTTRPITSSPEFEQWFDGSVVVDADDKPLVVYHGTSKDMDFKAFKIPGNGVWFARSPKDASDYAQSNDSQGHTWDSTTGSYVAKHSTARVIPVYLRIKNPVRWSAWPDEIRLASNYKRAQGIVFQRLRAQGHDGIIFADTVYVVLGSPDQIKSAIGNKNFSASKNMHEDTHTAARDPITSSPAFKRWFAGSKAVDAQGHPQRCFHGTHSKIDAFDHEAGTTGLSFFSTDPGFASGYASTIADGTGGNVIPVYLSIKKPFDYRTMSHASSEFYADTGGITDPWSCEQVRIDLYGSSDMEDGDNPDVHDAPVSEHEFHAALSRGSYPALEAHEFLHWLRGQHYDALLISEGGALNYAVFSPTQVKSSISNSGGFSPTSPLISESPEVEVLAPPQPGLTRCTVISCNAILDHFKKARITKAEIPRNATDAINLFERRGLRIVFPSADDRERTPSIKQFALSHQKGCWYIGTQGHAMALVDAGLFDTMQQGFDSRPVLLFLGVTG